MRSALIHGILLAVMLVYGYRTWTRDKTVKPDLGKVVLWDKAEADLVSIELKTEKKTVRLERRSDANGAYWWGTETTIEKKPKPVDPNAAGSAEGSGSGSAAPPPPEMIETQKVREFPLGESGTKLLNNYFAARALRDLGKPTDAAKKDYKLDDATTALTVTFKDGKRTFLVGGSVYGGSDRYVIDQSSGSAYVLSKDLVSNLETGETSLQLVDPKGIDLKLLEAVTIEAYGKKKDAARVTIETEGQQKKVWSDVATKQPNQTIGNFIDNTNNLKPTEYMAQLKPEQLTPVFKVTYKDGKGAALGTLVLFKAETVAKTPEDGDLDPTAPGRTEVTYYILTEKTRVPAMVRKDTAQRAEQDLPLVFSDKPPPEPTGPDVKGTPFEKPPQRDPHGHDDGHGHGTPPAGDPHGHGAPPLPPSPPPSGSAAPADSASAPKLPGATAPKLPAGSAAPSPTPAPGSAAAPKPAPAAQPTAPKPGSAAPSGHDGHAH